MAKSSKNYIEKLMFPQIQEIVQYWNIHGQIFEGQFAFASSSVMKDNSQTIFEIMKAYGADSFSDKENTKKDIASPVYTTGVEIPGEGWMNTMFAWGKMNLDTAEENAKSYYLNF